VTVDSISTIMKGFSIVVAATSSTLGIGRNGDLPWKLAEDIRFFKKVTSTATSPSKQNAVIMGRKTWESIPTRFRPLDGRINIVLSKNPNVRESLSLPESVIVAGSLDDAVAALNGPAYAASLDKIFVIGGGMIYQEAAVSQFCERIYLTEVEADIPDMDTFFPVITASKFKLVSRSQRSTDAKNPTLSYRFTEYEAIDNDIVISSPSIP
jgi:dihydrofolate reductase/thymidylate synthase